MKSIKLLMLTHCHGLLFFFPTIKSQNVLKKTIMSFIVLSRNAVAQV